MRILILIVSLTVIFFEGNCQNWTGSFSSDWNNSSNWSSWPLNGEDILIDPSLYSGSAFSPVIATASVFTPGAVIIQNGGELIISNNLSSSDDIEVTGAGSTLTINNGNFSVGAGNGGRLIISSGAAMNINGGNILVDQRFILEGLSDIEMNSGSITSGQRLIIGGGGSFVMNDGSISIVETFALVDGDPSRDSRFMMNGGSITTGELELENETGNFFPSFTINNGTLLINGDLIWFGVAPGTGAPLFNASGGSVTINGAILNMAGSTVNMNLKLQNNAVVNMNGSTIDLIHVNDSLYADGNSFFIINSAAIFNNEGVLYTTEGVFEINGSLLLLGSGIYQFHDLSVTTSATFNHFSPDSVSISGDLDLVGSFVTNQNTTILNGNDPQTISGNPADLYSAEIRNSSAAGVTLETPVTIFNSLNLVNGNLNTNSNDLVIFIDNAQSSQGSDSSFINGPVKKTGDDAFVFPTGKNNYWRRISVSAPASPSTEIIAEYFHQSYPDLTPILAPLISVSSVEYWSLSQVNSSDSVLISIYWEDAAASAINDCNDITIAHWGSAEWIPLLSIVNGSCSANDSGILSAGNIFIPDGIFTFGYYDEVYTQSFSICDGESITVGTNSYSETGSYIDFLIAEDNTDSTVVTHLNVIQPVTYSQNIEICNGDYFQVGSSIYFTPGNYLDSLQSGSGCDSIVITNLSILPAIDISVSLTSITLTANNTAADSYQWISCDGDSLLPGETGDSFTASVNGNYAVILTQGNCMDTSACVQINSVAVADIIPMEWNIFPNPVVSGEIFTISGLSGGEDVKIYDSQGRVIYHMINEQQNIHLELNVEAGLYYLIIENYPVKLIVR